MKYFKNTELVKIHNVSDKAVRNWISLAQQGKIDLDLVGVDNKSFIADSLKNDYMIEELVQKGKKYRNRRSHREVYPTQSFYDLYNSSQVIDIANALDKYSELPSHYRYFGSGASYWNAHLHKFYQSKFTNMLTATIELLKLEKGYFDSLLEEYDYVNLIDLGAGNGLAAKDLVGYLYDTRKLEQYIAIDCSSELLDITERNINEWFNGKIKFKRLIKDLGYERFTEALSSNNRNDGKSRINIILFLGGTIGNFREPSQVLRIIRDSLGREDILITSDEFDNENARNFFGSANIEPFSNVTRRNKQLLDLLSIDESFYDIERVFDEETNCQLLCAKLKVELTINFCVNDFQKTVNLRKGENILLFRMWEWTSYELVNLYEKNGLSQLRTTKLPNEEFVLLVSCVTSGRLKLTA